MVILDAGHGVNTKGKRSPKGLLSSNHALYEFEFNRDIVCRIIQLIEGEIEHIELVPEVEDIPLSERVERANKIFDSYPEAYLISVHANAGGGTGWEVFTSPGETKSDDIAQVFAEEAELAFPEFRIRKDLADGDYDKEAHFYILKNTKCPAILTENFFMDTEDDLAFIVSDEGRQRVAEMHYNAIIRYQNSIRQ